MNFKTKALAPFFVGLLMLFNLTQAKPVLVAVELNTQRQIQIWRDLNYPTYQFIASTAVAEVDDSQLSILEKQGFVCRIIDESPWSENYFLGQVPTEYIDEISDKIIWQKDAVILIKIAQERLIDLFNIPIQFQPLRRNVLPVRFWEQIMKKIVPIRILDWDPFIQSIVDQVNTDSLASYVQRMQDFATRLIFTDSSFAASRWLLEKFNSWGYSAEYDSFYISHTNWGIWPDTGYERNVVATMEGSICPNIIFIISGHFDAIIFPDTSMAWFTAPGADDNASGVAAALEAARIFQNYSWEPTIKFIGWSAEEVGLLGSDDYAHRAESLGLDIGGVVNLDMIGYVNDGVLDCNIQHSHPFSEWLSELFYQAGQLYAPSILYYEETFAGGSDDFSFAIRGYSAIWGAERWYFENPHWHAVTDLLTNMTPELYTDITKAAVATLAILGVYPSIVDDVVALDIGEGSSLEVTWSPSPESDVVGYNLYWGRESEVYTDTHFIAGITNTADTLTNLMTDSTYYIAVTAIDVDARESYGALEVIGVPRLIPLTPAGVAATPIISGIRIDWEPNGELDLAGYRVYRRVNDDPVYDSLNSILLPDTTYTNAPLSGANKYYYAVRAFDTDGNPSPMSSEVYGRPITFDQGILIVDETRNTPFPPNPPPPDSLQDEFYSYILAGYQYTEYEFDSLVHHPVFADFVPYSTVLWHADDYSELMADENVEDLRGYLDVGGKLWFVGWKPTVNLRGGGPYPEDFSSGDFIYDYLKISHVDLSAMSDSFQAATGLLGYPELDVDSVKVPVANWGGTLRFIEAHTSVAPAEDIYTMDMKNNSSPFEGEVCGVRYLGNDFKTVFFGFPLYFMDQDQARAAAQQVMADFGELYVAERPKDGVLLSGISLSQNVPNPFTGKTTISYQVPHGGNVSLKVYNIAGQLVRALVDEPYNPGVYTIVWDGRDNEGSVVSSGVYFYRLEVGEYSVVKKMTVLR